MSRSPSLVLLAALVIGLIGCDHATKHLAETELRGRPPTNLIAKVLDLQYTQNHDVGFSLLRKIPEKTRVPLIFAGGAAGLLLGTKLPSFHLYYSYDISFQRFQKFSTGTHEVTLAFSFKKKEKPIKGY